VRTLAIVPVKRFELAKQRLGEQLTPPQRAALARAMIEDVLTVLIDHADLESVLVVTNEASVATLAGELGAVVVADPHESGQSAAACVGIAHAKDAGFDRALLVPGDCPSLDPDEVGDLLQATLDAPSVLIVPDRHGTGTNALLLQPPDAIEPGFGPGSFARHRERAAAAGATFAVQEPPTLTLDIDTPDDLAALLDRVAPGAPRTRAVLAALETERP
jgi:2-phospho-L-lactate guanylyltransferase